MVEFVVGILGGMIAFAASLLVYFLPSIIADRRSLQNTLSIFCLNFFLGWTFIGWVIALCWAVSGTAARRVANAPIEKRTNGQG